MKYFKTYEAFKKDYMNKIDLKDFKKIKKGSKVLYMGSQVEVLNNNGYVLTLKGEDGKKFTVNKAMFDHGGMIKEGVMDNIHLMADASKDYEDFKKKFKKGFPKIFKSTPDFMDWLYGMYKDMAPDKVEEGIVNEKAKLKDLAKDLAELDKAGQSWISSITVEEDYDNKKGEDIAIVSVSGGAGDSTVKAYVNKLLKKLGFKPKFIQRNNKGDIHEYIWHLTQFTPDDVDKIDWKDLEYYRESVVNEKRINLKQAADYEKKLKKKVPSTTRAKAANHNGEVKLFVNYKRFADRAKLKAAGEDLGLTYVSDGRVTNRPGLDFKRGDKMVGGGGVLGITDNWMTFIKESVNEGIVDDLVAMGGEINYLYDADPKTQKIWKKAGFDPNDQDNIILYSYVNSWPETKKLLDKKRVKYKELEDPNSAGESYIVFKESVQLNEGINFQAILLKDAMLKYNIKPTGGIPRTLQFASQGYVKVPKGTFLIGLPGGLFAVNMKKKFAIQITSGSRTYLDAQDKLKDSDVGGTNMAPEFSQWKQYLNESMNELNTDGAIMDLWKKLYGEDFVSEYPAVAKILKVNRKNIDRRELARIWDETYGEDLKDKYPDFFKALK